MCRLRNMIAIKCDRRTDRQTDDGQSDPYVPLCFAGDTKNYMSCVFTCISQLFTYLFTVVTVAEVYIIYSSSCSFISLYIKHIFSLLFINIFIILCCHFACIMVTDNVIEVR